MRGSVAIAVGIAIAAACAWCAVAALITDPSSPPSADRPAAAPTGPQPAIAVIDRGTAEAGIASRLAVEAAPDAADTPPPTRSFDAVVDELIGHALDLRAALEREDRTTAEFANESAERLLADLRIEFPSAGELALDRRLRSVPTGAAVRDTMRRHVLERIMRDALRLRHLSSSDEADRSRLDTLVSAILDCLPLHEELAVGLGGGLLVGEPYLGTAHEPAVLELAELATELPFLVEVVAELLRTLWHNLQASDATTSDRLAALALLFLEDGNAARQLAALQQLLQDDRYRGLVLHQVVRSGDTKLAEQLAAVAASELAPRAALDVLRALQDVDGADLLGPFVLLGSRDAALLIEDYERVLADGIRPTLRAQLLTGACARGDAEGLSAARVAYALDSDPQVRLQAVYALAAQPDAEAAAAAIEAAIDDPRGAADPGWIGGITLALHNLALNHATNALERIGRRLATHPALDEAGRRAVLDLLAEHVPNRGR